MTDLNTCPVPDLATYRTLRQMDPTAIIPCAGEPIGMREGRRQVYSSDGNVRGWYDLTTDIFTPES